MQLRKKRNFYNNIKRLLINALTDSELEEVMEEMYVDDTVDVLIDTLEDAGYSVDDFDAVGALTAAAVPMVSAFFPSV